MLGVAPMPPVEDVIPPVPGAPPVLGEYGADVIVQPALTSAKTGIVAIPAQIALALIQTTPTMRVDLHL